MTIHLRKTPVALALLCALPSVTYAAPAATGIALRMQTSLVGVPASKSDIAAPVYMEADRLQGYNERETEAATDGALDVTLQTPMAPRVPTSPAAVTHASQSRRDVRRGT